MLDLLYLQSIQNERNRERARHDLIARARHELGPSPASPGVVARIVSRLRGALPRRSPCPDPPCPDLDPRPRAAFDR